MILCFESVLERFKNLDSNDSSFVGPEKVYVDGQSRDGKLYSIENFPNVIVNDNGDIHVVESFKRWVKNNEVYYAVTKVYQEEEWNDTNNSWDIVGGGLFLRNYSPYWLFGEKGDTFYWGSQGEGSGKMEWENAFCLFLNPYFFVTYILILPEKSTHPHYAFPDLFYHDQNIKRVHFGSYIDETGYKFGPPEEFIREFEKTKNANGEVEIEFTCTGDSASPIQNVNGTNAGFVFFNAVKNMRYFNNKMVPKLFDSLDSLGVLYHP